MGREHVGHDDIARFAQEKVNLPKDKADEYRAQARRLREEMGMQRMDTVRRPVPGVARQKARPPAHLVFWLQRCCE